MPVAPNVVNNYKEIYKLSLIFGHNAYDSAFLLGVYVFCLILEAGNCLSETWIFSISLIRTHITVSLQHYSYITN